jgi:hypothetical protein
MVKKYINGLTQFKVVITFLSIWSLSYIVIILYMTVDENINLDKYITVDVQFIMGYIFLFILPTIIRIISLLYLLIITYLLYSIEKKKNNDISFLRIFMIRPPK